MMSLEEGRYFLKDSIRKKIDFSKTDQNCGIPAPPIQKPIPENAEIISLPEPKNFGNLPDKELKYAISSRMSRRNFSEKPLSFEELSFLVWSVAGIRRIIDHGHALRTVPSAGCRHAIETMIAVFNVESMKSGIYRYLPLSHELLLLDEPEELAANMIEATMNQNFVGNCSATFIWTAVPERMEWRYGPASAKVIALDAGHICQNLYLACEVIHAGCCAVAAYDQEKIDEFLGLDGDSEFVVYLAPVGKRMNGKISI